MQNTMESISKGDVDGLRTPMDLSSCDGLTSIPEQCFAEYYGDLVVLPASVTSIGAAAFEGGHAELHVDLSRCTSLTELPPRCFAFFRGAVDLPPNLTALGDGCFESCTCDVDLSTFALTALPAGCFCRFDADEVLLPPTIAELGATCFGECRAAVDLSECPILHIPQECFSGFRGKKLDLPSTIETFACDAFCFVRPPLTLSHCLKIDWTRRECQTAFRGVHNRSHLLPRRLSQSTTSLVSSPHNATIAGPSVPSLGASMTTLFDVNVDVPPAEACTPSPGGMSFATPPPPGLHSLDRKPPPERRGERTPKASPGCPSLGASAPARASRTRMPCASALPLPPSATTAPRSVGAESLSAPLTMLHPPSSSSSHSYALWGATAIAVSLIAAMTLSSRGKGAPPVRVA